MSQKVSIIIIGYNIGGLHAQIIDIYYFLIVTSVIGALVSQESLSGTKKYKLKKNEIIKVKEN